MNEQAEPEERIAESLAAYVPFDRLAAMAEGRTLPARAAGAALFADISGFTPLTEALDKGFGPRRGGEELTRHLNAVYGGLIEQVHAFRGSVIGFSGDAMTCWFDGDGGPRAVACGARLQESMGRFQAISTPAGAMPLALKVSVVAGSAYRRVVGDPSVQLFDVLCGALLDRMARADGLAKPGEIVVGEEVVAAAGGWAEAADWRGAASGERYAVLGALREAPAPEPWPLVDAGALDGGQLRPWLLPPVYERLRGEQGDFIAEVRQTAALFLHFGGLNFEADEAVGEKFDAYVRWAQGVLTRYDGALVQLTTGDKGSYFYAVFGAPLAPEGVVERALSAALALRSPPPSLSFIDAAQIGISYGQMRTGAYGGATRRTYGVLGDETNVAARLMARAEAGQIVVTERVATGGEAMFRFGPLGAATLKGKRAPMPLFELLGREGAGQEGRRRPWLRRPIVGRERERERLAAIVDRLHAGGERLAVLIEGEAGIGKSRLVGDLLDRARAKRDPSVRCLVAGADAIERTTPYFAWRRVFARLLGIAGHLEPEQMRATIAGHLPESLMPLAPLLNPLLPIDLPETALSGALRGNHRATQTPRFLANVFRALAGASPLLLVLEDAHWLDSGSWALLELVRQEAPALLLALTTRPIERPPEPYRRLCADAAVETLRLEALPAGDVTALVCQHLGVRSLPAALSALLRDKSGGNPFFAGELGQALRDAGVIRVEGGECHVERLPEALSFPDTIEGVVTSRIDRLAPPQQLTLKVASIIGRVFDSATVKDVFPLDTDRGKLSGFLDDLARVDLTTREAPGPQTYSFKHALTQEIAYNLMLFEQRRPLHEAVADWYEREHAGDLAPFRARLAHHRLRAIEGLASPGDARLRRAIDALVCAGKQSLEGGASAEALAHLGEARALLGRLPPSPDAKAIELDLCFSYGAALAVVRGPTHPDVRREFDLACELCRELGETLKLFEALFGIWYSHLTSAERAGAVEFSGQLLALALKAGDPSMLALAHHASGATDIYDGRYVEGLGHMHKVLALAERSRGGAAGALVQARNPLVMTFCYCGWANWLLGHPDRARDDAEQAIARAEKVPHSFSLNLALSFAALVHCYRREPEQVQALAERTRTHAAEHGAPYWVWATTFTQGWLAIESGEYESAVEMLTQGLAREREVGVFPLAIFIATVELIDALVRAGRHDEAASVIGSAKALREAKMSACIGPEIDRLEGELWARRGDDGRAEACFGRALALSRPQRARSLELRAQIGLARLRKRQGRALDPGLRELFGWFTEGHDTKDLLEARALLEGGPC